ncbi:hypothetical protein ACIQ34_04225 [Ureibacillus sp. NPDC094379]
MKSVRWHADQYSARTGQKGLHQVYEDQPLARVGAKCLHQRYEDQTVARVGTKRSSLTV